MLIATGGYDGRALFENLELVRTVVAAGGREMLLDGVFIARRPSTARHFASQRVRQAYDEFARPVRLAVQLTVLPAGMALAVAGRWRAIAAFAAATALAAEVGRRRKGGRRVFPARTSLFSAGWPCRARRMLVAGSGRAIDPWRCALPRAHLAARGYFDAGAARSLFGAAPIRGHASPAR